MDEVKHSPTGRAEPRNVGADSSPAYQAYQWLHWGFVAAPAIAGADKFTHLLTDWDQYLAPSLQSLLPMSGHAFMLVVGVIELFAAVLVAVKPWIGAYVVGAWLGGIIFNLLLAHRYYDIALRDFGLMLGALALSRLSTVYDASLIPGRHTERQ